MSGPTYKYTPEIECHYVMTYRELDTIINETFDYPNKDKPGYEFTIVASEEWNNGESHEFQADPNEEMDDWDREKFEEFLSTGYSSYIGRILMNELARRQIIPPGDYLINVSW